MMSNRSILLFKLSFWVLGKGLLLAMCAEIQVQLCADPAAMCIGWEGNCKEILMNEWMRKIVRELNLWVILYELMIIVVLWIFCLLATKICVTECLDLDLFLSFYIMLYWWHRKNITIDLVHMDANRYLINSAQNKVI